MYREGGAFMASLFLCILNNTCVLVFACLKDLYYNISWLFSEYARGEFMNKKRILGTCVAILLVVSMGIGIMHHQGYEVADLLGEEASEKLEELLHPVSDETKEYVSDLSKAYDIILEKGTRDFFEGYTVDYSFLNWVNSNFGDAVVMDIAYRLYEGYVDAQLWYKETGNSMHVLWIMYCDQLQYATYNLENVHWMESEDETITIDLTGDINLADDWYTMQTLNTKTNGIYDCISEDVVNELQSADISVINNEFVFSDGGDRQVGKAYTFRSQTANVWMLDAFGTDLANLANNHTYDYQDSGLMDTIFTLESYGIETMGAGNNIEEAKAIQYYIVNGRKIAFVSATEIEKFYRYTKEATATEAGVLKTLDPTIYNEVIAEAKAHSDYVIASVHWGTEGTYQYSNSQHGLAEEFVNAGADVVIGGHPHRLQGVEFINNVPVVYSLGNFWFSTGTLYTTIAQVEIDEDGELALRLIPCIQKDLTTSILATKEEQDAFYKFMADISYGVVIDQNGYFYNTQNGQNSHLIDGVNYLSAMNYGFYSGSIDLEGRPIDVVGNLK